MLRISTLTIALALGTGIQAIPLTSSEALSRAIGTNAPMAIRSDAGFPSFKLTASDDSPIPSWYLFESDNDRYIITSGDDMAAPILGYGELTSDHNVLCPQMVWWLSQYSEEINAARSIGAGSTYSDPTPAGPAIAPMIRTKWNQGSPYNLLCPEKEGKLTYTGCVATAMAQVMKYFEYPTKGSGSHSYLWNGQTLSMDFGSTVFSWKSMENIYNSTSSRESETDVATLMKACGYALDMDYGTDASAANVYDWAPALITYFGYAPSLTPLNRLYYTTQDWEKAVYTSLAGGSPVLYGGQGSIGGHAFVCDGYDGEGFFHFNWGWSGSSDGYYRLGALNPPHQGIGGGDGGFNARQMAVVNIKPEYSGATSIPILGTDMLGTLSYSNISGNFSYSSTIYNYSNSSLSFKIGFEIRDSIGNISYIGGDRSWIELPVLGTLLSYSRGLSQPIANGTYKIRPAFAVEETSGESGLKWYRVAQPVTGPDEFTFVMKDGKGTIYSPSSPSLLKVSDLKALREFHPNLSVPVSMTITNDGSLEVQESVYMLALDKPQGNNRVISASNPYPVYLTPGESQPLETTLSINAKPGKYYIVPAIGYTVNPLSYIPLCTPLEIEVHDAAETVKLSTDNLKISLSEAEHGVSVGVLMDVKCSEGYYSQPIYLWIGKNGSWPYPFVSPTLYLLAGESESVEVNYLFTEAVSGETYDLIANYRDLEGRNQYLAKTSFLCEIAGVRDLEHAYPDSISEIRFIPEGWRVIGQVSSGISLYSLDGREIPVNVSESFDATDITTKGASVGPYILKIGNRTFKVILR